MLDFFRRHQRGFFIFISVVIVISFSFFGTFRAMGGGEEAPDIQMGTAIDGSPINRKEVLSLVHFLSREGMRGEGGLARDFLTQDLMRSGIAALLFENYAAELSPDFEERLSRIKGYKPYAHPRLPLFSAEAIWENYAPVLAQELHHLNQQSHHAAAETFAIFCRLFVAQKEFPPELLKQLLLQQQQQLSWLPPDRDLPYRDLSLFGFQSTEQWFGGRFLELMSQFVLNSSRFARQQGYKVSYDEAYADLLKQATSSLSFLLEQEKITAQEAHAYMRHEFQAIGLEFSKGVALWQEILYFRRLFDQVSDRVFLDSLAHRQFYHFTEQTLTADVYELPPELKFSDLNALLKFQVYLEAACDKEKKTSVLALPKRFIPVAELEKKFPELASQSVELEIAQISKSQLGSRISLKEMWEWQVADQNWAKLQEQFPQLAASHSQSSQERFKYLEDLDPKNRQEIDRVSREEMIQQHPEWLYEALDHAPREKRLLALRAKGGAFPLTGVSDRLTFLALLDKAPLTGEEGALLEEFKAFSQDEEHIYRIGVIRRDPEKKIISFEEANREGILDELLIASLEVAYPNIRKKQPSLFQKDNKEWKPLKEVQIEVAKLVYEDLLQAIQNSLPPDLAQDSSPHALARLRFCAEMQKIKEKIQQGVEESLVVRDTEKKSDLPLDFRLLKRQEKSSRSDGSFLSREENFHLSAGSWSSLTTSKEGAPLFFHLLESTQEEKEMENRVSKAQEELGREAKMQFAKQLLSQIKEKQAITLIE